MPEGAIATGEQNNLHPRRSLHQDFGHEIEAGIVGIDERVVQDQRYRHSLLKKHVGKGKP
ncbi:hypothetical protein LTR94_035335, partial [Friedmanniomyces endolithicus]